MSKLKVYDLSGVATGDLELSDDLMVLNKGDQAVHDSVLAHMAARRAGTASTKRKGEVAGSNKKPWKQKGTGRARAGLRQSPVWRGGGVAFGPHPRSFEMKVNRKVAGLAFCRAFSEKVAVGDVRVIDSLEAKTPQTRTVVAMLKGMKLAKGALILVDKVEKNLALACRNLAKVNVVRASDVTVYDVLKYPVILVNRAGMDQIKQRLSKAGKGAE
jgi:large subunit ribosomal protein L4